MTSHPQPKVLVIEDEEPVRDSFRNFLEDQGYEVFEAANGREGIELFQTCQPDVVLIDLRMPEMNGHQCFFEMKKIDNGLTKVDKLQDFDIVIAHTIQGKRPLYHCGLYYQGHVAHCSQQLKQVVYEPYSEFIADYDGVTKWR